MNTEKQADAVPSSETETVPISLGERSYTIHIRRGLLPAIGDYVPFDMTGRALFVLTDENVSVPWGGQVYEALKACGPHSVQLLALPTGEQTKSFNNLERVIAWLLDHGVERGSVLFAVGGGVIGDLGGFAAATVLRGIHYVQVPTSLLAQVDSSVGGKTGINAPQGKNLVGAFYQPQSVVCDLAALDTLPRREVLAGYAEIVKYGLIGDAEFFLWLEQNGEKVCALDPAALAKAVAVSCRKKAEIVAADEREHGQRALLNLGHTFGHALEAAAGYDGRLLHGEAVAIGMVLAFRLSHRAGLCRESDADRVEAHLAAVGLPTRISMIFPPLDVDAQTLAGLMKTDKKMEQGRLRFIVVNGIGKAHVSADIDPQDVLAVLEHSSAGS